MTLTYVILVFALMMGIGLIVAICCGSGKKKEEPNRVILSDDSHNYGEAVYDSRNYEPEPEENLEYDDENDATVKPDLDAYMSAEEDTGTEVESGIEAESGIKAQMVTDQPEPKSEPEEIKPDPEPVRAVVPVRKPVEQEFADQRNQRKKTEKVKSPWQIAKTLLWVALILVGIVVLIAAAAAVTEHVTGQPIGMRFWTICLASIAAIFFLICAIVYRKDKDAWIWWCLAIICAAVAVCPWWKLVK